MRTEREMTALILGVAERDARVRAVFMNGSRANPNAPRDIFQDYDIVYVVEETASFRAQPGWVDVFGERLVMQTPDEMDHAAGQPTDLARCYGYLMQFADGNRIDLRLMTLPRALEECQSDSQTIVLLDKDGILPPLPPPGDGRSWIWLSLRQDPLLHLQKPYGSLLSQTDHCDAYLFHVH